MVDITFEAYFGKFQDGRYLLYLDDADINLLEIIGYENIHKIVFEALKNNSSFDYYDLVAYDGKGELTDIFGLIRQHGLYFDMIRKIHINDDIELDIMWWEDHIIIADYDLILKCIQTKKKNASLIEIEVLDLILNNSNTYFQTQDDKIEVQKVLKAEDFYSFIAGTEHYQMKEQNLLLDFEDEIENEKRIFL
jgi:hypothetical protein